MVKLMNSTQIFNQDDLIESFSKIKKTDCILYSEEGTKFKIHRELLYQTKFMQNILFSANQICCGNIEIFCPCSTYELEYIVKFLYSGKISYEKDVNLAKILNSLSKIFGYPKELFFDNHSIDPIADTFENIDSSEINPIKSENQDCKIDLVNEEEQSENGYLLNDLSDRG